MPYDDKGPEESRTPQDRGFNARSLIYVLIPLGFVLLVAFMMLGGEAVQETTDGSVADPVEEQLD